MCFIIISWKYLIILQTHCQSEGQGGRLGQDEGEAVEDKGQEPLQSEVSFSIWICQLVIVVVVVAMCLKNHENAS